jgi:hypothetical protein
VQVTVPVTTRMTESMVAELDRVAAGLHLTRGSAVVLLLAAALRHEDELLGSFRELRARTNPGGHR